MNFGEKLRQLRNERNLTQPDLAEAMGIEQSYLSKLENDKSLPSNDVFNRILDVFELEVSDFVSDLDQRARNQLRQIPDVASHFNHQKQQIIGNRRRWLMSSALMLSVGIALIYAGWAHLFFPDVIYQYKSHGIVLEGESKEIFANPHQFISETADRETAAEFLNAIRARTDEVYTQARTFQGNVFNVEVDGGSRTFYLTNERKTDPWPSKAIVFVGVFLALFGLIGIFLEKKLSR